MIYMNMRMYGRLYEGRVERREFRFRVWKGSRVELPKVLFELIFVRRGWWN